MPGLVRFMGEGRIIPTSAPHPVQGAVLVGGTPPLCWGAGEAQEEALGHAARPPALHVRSQRFCFLEQAAGKWPPPASLPPRCLGPSPVPVLAGARDPVTRGHLGLPLQHEPRREGTRAVSAQEFVLNLIYCQLTQTSQH